MKTEAKAGYTTEKQNVHSNAQEVALREFDFSLGKMGRRAQNRIEKLSQFVNDKFTNKNYYREFSRTEVRKALGLTDEQILSTFAAMEADGYEFTKTKKSNGTYYKLGLNDISALSDFLKLPRFRDRLQDDMPFVVFVFTVKGGAAKTLSTVSAAHGMRVHKDLLREDLRILVIDLDPQASGTMFLAHEHLVTSSYKTALSAMLYDVSAETLANEFILKTRMPGVDVLPANLADAFMASDWDPAMKSAGNNSNSLTLLRDNVIKKLKGLYDIVLIDTGPHMDVIMKNAIMAADMLAVPVPPATVDRHSTYQFLKVLPPFMEKLELESGEPHTIKEIVGYASKFRMNLAADKHAHSEMEFVFYNNTLKSPFPYMEGFQRTGITYDTVISADPKEYLGSPESLTKARNAALDFSMSLFNRIEIVMLDHLERF